MYTHTTHIHGRTHVHTHAHTHTHTHMHVHTHMRTHIYTYTHTWSISPPTTLFSPQFPTMFSRIPILWLAEWFCSCLYGVEPVLWTVQFTDPGERQFHGGAWNSLFLSQTSVFSPASASSVPPASPGSAVAPYSSPYQFLPSSSHNAQLSLIFGNLPPELMPPPLQLFLFSPLPILLDSSSSSSLFGQPILWLMPSTPHSTEMALTKVICLFPNTTNAFETLFCTTF